MKVLVVVDVQKEFNKFIQHDLVDELYDYARKFKHVYQIWDTHKNDVAPTYVFPNQVDAVKKKYGKNHFSDKVRKFIKDKTDETFEGNLFKLSDGEGYIVRVDNNHDWFYVNPEIVELIQKIKDDQVILVGGADNECLEDVYQAFKAFGLNVHINKKYIYSAKTDQNDSVQDNVSESFSFEESPYKSILFKVKGLEDIKKIVDLFHDLHGIEKDYPKEAIMNEFREYFEDNTFEDLIVVSSTQDKFDGVCEDDIEDYVDSHNKADAKIYTVQDLGKFGATPTYSPRRIDKTLEKINLPNKTNHEEIKDKFNQFKYDWLLIRIDGRTQQLNMLEILETINKNMTEPLFVIREVFYRNDPEFNETYWGIPLKSNLKFPWLTIYSVPYGFATTKDFIRRIDNDNILFTDMTYPGKVEVIFSKILGTTVDPTVLYSPRKLGKENNI